MKILVTGANGYIGSKVVKMLCDFGGEVIATDLFSDHIDSRATFVKADIFSHKDNWFAFFGEPDVCLHMAWRNGFIHDSPDHMGDLSSHFLFLTNLIDNGLRRVAVMGSMHEVGYYVGAITEATPCLPMSQYGIAKNALRQSVCLYASEKRCDFQWLRGFYIYGDDTFGSSIFAKIRKSVLKGEKTFPLNSGKNKCDFIFIDDLAKQIAATVLQNDILGVINVCSGIPIELGKEVEWYISYYHLPISLEYNKFPDRPYDSPCIYGDNAKIKAIMDKRSGGKLN